MGRARGAAASSGATLAMTGAVAASAALVAFTSARWLGPNDRGIVVIVVTLATTLVLVGALGSGIGLRVLMSEDPPLHPKSAVKHGRTLAVTTATAVLGVGSLTCVIARRQELVTVGLLSALTGFMLWNYVSRETNHGLGHHIAALAGEVLSNTVTLIYVISAQLLGELRAEGVLLVMVCGSALQQVILNHFVASTSSAASLHAYGFRELIRYCLPATLGPLGGSLIAKGDRLILGWMLGAAPVGIYATAATMADMLSLIGVALAQIVFRRVAQEKTISAGTLRVMCLAVVATAVGAVIVLFLAPFLIRALLGDAYASASTPLRALAVAAIFMSAHQVLVAALNGFGEFRVVRRITLTGLFVIVVGCLALVPTYGINGAAFLSLACYLMMAVASAYAVRSTVLKIARDGEGRVASQVGR